MKMHIIGIGGIGVSALAQYYLAQKEQVSGSDLVSSDIIKLLKKKGAKIFTGPHNSRCLRPDLKQVIYSPAVQEDNPELKKARRLGIKCLSYPQALGELTKKYFTIAVSGTHGKSTTTAMLALILIKAGLDPTVIVGTKLKEFNNSNFHLGKSKYLIIEACEHEESFLNYWPKIIIINNIESDHLDYYKNLNNILNAFAKFVKRLPNRGVLIVNGDDKNSSKFKAQKFSIKQKEARKLKEILKVPGEHNIYNALAALTTARILKIPDKISYQALSEYKGCWRRFEISQKGKLKIIQDYAHHPTEIKATLSAAKDKFPQKRIWCVFQPHQYQRTFYLFKDFVKVFNEAINKKWLAQLIITDIYDVLGREDKKIEKKVSSQKLVQKIKQNVKYISSISQTAAFLKKNLKNNDILIIMGAGDIYQLSEKLKK